MQSTFRGINQKMKYREKRNKIIKIQKFMKKKIFKNHLKKLFERVALIKRSNTKISSFYKMKIQRKNYLRKLICAAKINKIIRGFLSRQTVKFSKFSYRMMVKISNLYIIIM